jgi:hypothetical protein
MTNHGIRRPGLNLLIAVAIAAAGGLAVLWGVTTMNALGKETSATATAIGVGMLVGFLGLLFVFNFLWAVRLTAALRRGEGVIARWTVAPATFDHRDSGTAAGEFACQRDPGHTAADDDEIGLDLGCFRQSSGVDESHRAIPQQSGWKKRLGAGPVTAQQPHHLAMTASSRHAER